MVKWPSKKWQRRDYLAAAGLAGISGLAGCSETDETNTTNNDETTSNTSATTDANQEDGESSPGEENEQQPRLTVQDSLISTDQVVIGTEITVTTTIENTGNAPGEFDIELTLGDKRKQLSVELNPGEIKDISASASPMTVGEKDILLNNKRLDTIEIVPVASEDDRTVGAHYFSWYGTGQHTWRDGEWSLESPHTPTLGNYDVKNKDIIEQHIDWCHYAGVQWLNAVWNGPGAADDIALTNAVLDHPRADELDWSVMIATSKSTFNVETLPVDMDDSENQQRLTDLLNYMKEEFLNYDFYKTIDDRPVIYLYTSNSFTGDVVAAFEQSFRQAGIDPYFIIDLGPFSIDTVALSEIADAVTAYNPYNSQDNIEEVFLDQMESLYRSWYLTTEVTDHDVVPTVIPGYNDSEITHVERNNSVLELSTDRYANACEVGHKYAEGPIFVTAFNEWYESTFIEPSEEFGTSFLEITADKLAVDEWESPITEGIMVTLSFEKTVPATELAPGTDDERDLTMRVYELSIFNEGEKVREINVGGPEDGIDFLQGYFASESDSNGETARWLGNQTTSTLFFNDISEIDRIEIIGWAGTEMEVSATVDDELLGKTQVMTQRNRYTIG